jgi:hypothetical protein
MIGNVSSDCQEGFGRQERTCDERRTNRAGPSVALAFSALRPALWCLPTRPARIQPRGAAAGSHGVEKPNVVLITLDTTRADHLGSYGHAEARTPATDALARAGVSLCAGGDARAAHAARARLADDRALSHVSRGPSERHNGAQPGSDDDGRGLHARGYQTGAFIGAFVLDSRWGLNQGFGVYDDQFDLHKFRHLDLAGVQRRGDEVMDRALDWLDGHKQGPFFAWVHLYDAHSPYEPPEPLLSDFRSRGLAGLYDGEIAFADQQVARCISWLQRSGLDQRTIVGGGR